MGTEERTDPIADLDSADPAIVRTALALITDRLRSGQVTKRQLDRIGAAMVRLAEHEHWQVRRTLAKALFHLHHPTFHHALAPLLEDRNAWTRDAAERTLARRDEVARAGHLGLQHADLLERWVSEIEQEYGPRARRKALLVAHRFAGSLIRVSRHELRNVVLPLSTSLELLRGEMGRPRLRRDICLDEIERAERALEVHETTLDWLRELTAEFTHDFRREDLCDILDSAIDTVLRKTPKEDRVDVEREVEVDLAIDAHRNRLVQAFSNLIQNAFDAYRGMDRKTPIHISARSESPGFAVVVIEDRGRGMTDSEANVAFQIFKSSKPGGSGVGLSIARQFIVFEHGGNIALRSKPGHGTRIRVSLPIDQDAST